MDNLHNLPVDNSILEAGRQTSSGNVKGADGAFPLDLQTLCALYPYTLQYSKGYEYASNLPSGSCGEPVLPVLAEGTVYW